jgi:predicted Rossmann-fold nucleotide-binding protein
MSAEFVMPPRRTLYTPTELFAGFDPDLPGSLGRTPDFRAYLAAEQQGQRAPENAGVAEGRALHDVSITRALGAELEGEKPIAIMGGHGQSRRSADYGLVARIAHSLADDFLVLSGGGPGAMEAAHLGARFAGHPLEPALNEMAAAEVADFPLTSGTQLVRDGAFDPAALESVQRWIAPAIAFASRTEDAAGRSIGIPTWQYGHEPPTPFATRQAKYYQNSIREDGLLAVAVYGIIYAPGSAGTLQEVFQDAAQNFYAEDGLVSPMVFLDLEGKWASVVPILETLFAGQERSFIHIVDSAEEAVAAIRSHRDAVDAWAQSKLERNLAVRKG